MTALKNIGPSIPDVALEALARRVKSLREQLRLTQEEFSKRIGISVSFASLLERGERAPSYETLVAVAKALEVPLADLFRDGVSVQPEDPSHTQLLDFARKAHLTRAQVERYIAVGHAMFGLDHDPRTRARVPQLCAIEGCTRSVLARALCGPHYHQQRRRRG